MKKCPACGSSRVKNYPTGMYCRKCGYKNDLRTNTVETMNFRTGGY